MHGKARSHNIERQIFRFRIAVMKRCLLAIPLSEVMRFCDGILAFLSFLVIQT